MADVPRPTTAEAGTPPVPPAPEPAAGVPASRSPRHAAPGRAPWWHTTPPGERPAPLAHGLGRTAGRVLAVAFAVAWLLCPTVEPMPADDTAHPLWQLPIDLAAVATVVGAVVALWRGSRHAARLALAAGVLMAVETITCPLAGHTPLGWWTWVQTGLSLAVMAAGVALHRIRPATSGQYD